MQDSSVITDSPTASPEVLVAANHDSTDVAPREVRFQFTGSGGEYFSIWIVNLLLSILTLGIYSAWAKVRREQYFCRNTLLDEHSFDYTGDPLRILMGRIIALVVVVAGSFAQEISSTVALLVTAAFALAFPWIVVLSLRFRARNTRYRNVAFQFFGSTAEAAKVFLWIFAAALPFVLATIFLSTELPATPQDAEAVDPQELLNAMSPIAGAAVLSMLLAVVLWPAYQRNIKGFVHGNLRYGNAQGGFDGTLGDFYRAASTISAISALGWAVVAVIAAFSFSIGALWPMWTVVIATFLSRAAYTVVFTNVTMAHTTLAGQRFRSDMRVGAYAILLFGNALMLLLTLGLASPWTQVRHARYRLGHTSLIAAPNVVAAVLAGAQEHEAAFADEAAEFLDFDVSL